MLISKTASRNVAFKFKAFRVNEFLMANQGQVKSRNLMEEGSDSKDDNDKQIYTRSS